MTASQLELMPHAPRDRLLTRLAQCEIRPRDGWHAIVYPPTGQVVPGAQVDFHHPTLRKNVPYRPRRFRTRSEAVESLERLCRDLESGRVVVGAP